MTELELVQLQKNIPTGTEVLGRLQDDDYFLVKVPRTSIYDLSPNGTSPSRQSTVVESPSPAARTSSQ